MEALLGLLSLGPMSGYELQRTIVRTIGNFWQESFGQIYPALRKLVAEDLAEVEQRAEPGSARVSKVYRLTEKGRARLGDWLEMPCTRQVARDELLLKIFFGASTAPGAILSHVRAQQALLTADLERYRAAEARLPVAQRDSPGLPFFLLCVRHGIATAEAKLRWCEESLADLQDLEIVETEEPANEQVVLDKEGEPAIAG